MRLLRRIHRRLPACVRVWCVKDHIARNLHAGDEVYGRGITLNDERQLERIEQWSRRNLRRVNRLVERD